MVHDRPDEANIEGRRIRRLRYIVTFCNMSMKHEIQNQTRP